MQNVECRMLNAESDVDAFEGFCRERSIAGLAEHE